MSTSSTCSPSPETSVRKLRTFLGELMAQGASTPAICQRIRETRERLQEQWKADHPGERGNPFTQEKVAGRIGQDGITVGAYGAFERYREPDMQRLREIAQALGLDEDYFMPMGDLATATARVEAEADRLAKTTDAMEELLGQLRALLPPGAPAQARDVPS
jgi:transcriptional regulator with XRE-family HTH domain